MRESVIYQDILAEGMAKGRQEGRQEGRLEALLGVAANLLRRGISPETVAVATGLNLAQVQALENSND